MRVVNTVEIGYMGLTQLNATYG
ncbi:hypothetical protein LCGC14_1426460, partial [marine sediment metagenome]